MKNKLTFFALAASLLMACSPTFAHHGSSVSYDLTKQVTATGTVTQFMWQNPHIFIMYDVKDDRGNVVNWGAEGHDPHQMTAKGWNKETLKPGDQITISVYPSKAGTPRGLWAKITLNGKVILDDTKRAGDDN